MRKFSMKKVACLTMATMMMLNIVGCSKEASTNEVTQAPKENKATQAPANRAGIYW